MAFIDDRRKTEPHKDFVRPWRVRWKDLGSGKYRSKQFATRKEAKDFLPEAQAAEQHGTFLQTAPEQKKATVRVVAQAYLANPVLIKSRTQAISNGYLSAVKTHLALLIDYFGDLPIITLTRDRQKLDEYESHIARGGRSNATVNRYMHSLHMLLRYAEMRGYIPQGTPMPKHHKRRETKPEKGALEYSLTPEQMRAAVDHAPDDFRAFIALATHTGMRLGELLALQVRSINFDGTKSTVRVTQAADRDSQGFKSPKTYEGREIPIGSPALLKLLQDHIVTTASRRAKRPYLDLVFPNPSGNMFRGSYISSKVWSKTKAAAGIPDEVNFHHIRRSYGSLLIDHLRDVVEVSKLLGHSSVTTTMNVYARRIRGRRDEVSRIITDFLSAPEVEADHAADEAALAVMA